MTEEQIDLLDWFAGHVMRNISIDELDANPKACAEASYKIAEEYLHVHDKYVADCDCDVDVDV